MARLAGIRTISQKDFCVSEESNNESECKRKVEGDVREKKRQGGREVRRN